MESKYIYIVLTEEQANILVAILFHEAQFENDEVARELYFCIDNQIAAQTITEEEGGF